MKKVEERVKQILVEIPETRDNDMKLYSLVLRRVYGPHIETMSALELLNAMWKSKIPHLTSVLRCRQLLQQHNKALRGEKYHERQNRSIDVKEEIKNWDNKQSEMFG